MSIYALAGNDTVSNTGSSAAIYGGDGNDYISNYYANYVLINGGGGDDTISLGTNAMYNVIQYNPGEGNDIITDFKVGDTLQIGDGSDSYSTVKSGSDLIVEVGGGSITLVGAANLSTVNINGVISSITVNYKNNTIVNGTNSADTIENYGASVIINAYDGADSITNQGMSTTIYGDGNNDSVWNSGENVSIYGNYGDDRLENHGRHSSIDGGDGNDDIFNSGVGSYINGDYGNDSITNVGNASTIVGGYGNDYINLSSRGNVIRYNSGEGDDTINGFNSDDTLQIGDGYDTYSTVVSSNDLVVNVGGGSIILENAAEISSVNILGTYIGGGNSTPIDEPLNISNVDDNINITGSEYGDTITNYGENVEIHALGGDDFVYNYGASSVIDLGDGDDDIESWMVYATVIGGNGNDFIRSYNSSGLIYGNDGKDYIELETIQDFMTVNGGTGNDTILRDSYNENNGILFEYNSGDGNDVIIGFNKTSTLKIGNGADTYSTVASGNNLVVKVGNGAVTLAGGASHAVNILGTYVGDENPPVDDEIFNYNDNTAVFGTSSADTITNYGKNVTIQALGGNDYVTNYAMSAIIDGGAGNDTLTGNLNKDLFVYSAGKDVITNYDSDDTISLASAYSKASIKGDDVIFTFDSKNSLTVKDSADKIIKFADGTTFGGSSGISTTLTLTDADKSSVTLDSAIEIADASQRTKAIKIYGNDLANTIIGGSGNDKIWGEGGDDLFVYTSGKDIINDYDDGDTISLSTAYSSASIKGDDVIFTFDSKNNLTVKDSASKIIKFADGTTYGGSSGISTTLTLTDADKSSVTLGSGVEIADASARTKSIKIYGNDLANTIIGGSGNDKIWGEDGDDTFVYGAGKDIINDYDDGDTISLTSAYSSASIKGDDVIFTFDSKNSLTVKDSADKIIKFADGTTFGGEISDSKTLTLTNDDKSSVTLNSGVEIADASDRTKAIKIYGNDLANTIIGGSGNDRFWGEDGDDLFVYTAGKDIINDYDDGDTISLTSAYSSASIKGDDVIFTFDSKNSLTVKDSSDKIINFADGTTFGGEISDSKTLTLTNADKSSVTLGSGVEIADASARTKAIKIYGNDLDNTIIGGSGNDKFWGNGGSDTFIYSDGGGKDVINDFGDDDLLEIVGEFSATYKKSSGDVVFKVGDGSITLKDTSATIFNVNGENYHISSTKLEK